MSAGATAPDPAGGAYSAPPGPLAGFKGPTSNWKKGWGREGDGKEKRTQGKGKERGKMRASGEGST